MANLAGWDNVPLRDRLSTRLEWPVSLDNDGNTAALGEYWACRVKSNRTSGRANSANADTSASLPPYQGRTEGGPSRITAHTSIADRSSTSMGDDLVMLTLGTGVGAGIVMGGRILHGHFENAGEIGHMIVVRNGEPCACGQRGCLERYASAENVVRRVVSAIAAGESCALKYEIDAGHAITASRVAECARDGDALCTRLWNEACTYLAQACVNIQHIVNPARIVLGGGMTAAGDLLIDGVTEAFSTMTWKMHNDCPTIELSRLGSNAGVIGAAALRMCGPA